VEADIFRDGHDILRAVVKWKEKGEKKFSESPMTFVDNDRWRGSFPLKKNTRYVFTIEAWTDLYATWQADFRKREEAGELTDSDVKEGEILKKRKDERAHATVFEPELEIVADRPRALFGAWYEIFVRSQGTVPGKGATFSFTLPLAQ
jgi:starch synthase (maltosyl-transferring)